MIQRTTIITMILLALSTGGILFQVFYSPSQKESIEEILTQEITMPKQEDKFPNKQIRKGVIKDLWMSDKNHLRLHHQIKSPRSVLTAIPNGNQIDLIEQMIGMKCFFQEKFEKEDGKTYQQIRFLESGEGTYHYTHHYFDAQSVFLALYRIPGDTLITRFDDTSPFLKGIAEEISLSFSNGVPKFKAEKFKAQIRPQDEK